MAQDIKVCPYFLNKVDKNSADLILLPYNYIISESIRKRMSVELTDNIIIFDEAHNIGQAAEDALKIEISTKELTQMEKELTLLIKEHNGEVK